LLADDGTWSRGYNRDHWYGGQAGYQCEPQADFVNTYTSTGINREVPPHYYGRFEHAFVKEANEWTSACLDDTKLPMKLSGALRAVEIGSQDGKEAVF